ncbi:MAG: hypothetical protein ACPLXC_02610 [Candidatus Pacearchaeota archaeon]
MQKLNFLLCGIFFLLLLQVISAQHFADCIRPRGGAAPLWRHLHLDNQALAREFEDCAAVNPGSSIEEIIDAISLDENAAYGCRVAEGVVTAREILLKNMETQKDLFLDPVPMFSQKKIEFS